MSSGNAETNPFPGSPIVRGPIGGDQYTQVHNYVFRDPTLSAKAMGIFGHLSTHQESWRVTETTIAKTMRAGRETVRSALRELKQRGYVLEHDDGTWSVASEYVGGQA